MKQLLILLPLVFLIGCAKDDNQVYQCGSEPIGLSDLEVGLSVSNNPAFKDHPFSIVDEGTCFREYEFSELNTDTQDWCYYYSVNVYCGNMTVHSVINE